MARINVARTAGSYIRHGIMLLIFRRGYEGRFIQDSLR